MATALPVTLAGPSGVRIYGGGFPAAGPSELAGSVVAADAVASGSMAPAPAPGPPPPAPSPPSGGEMAFTLKKATTGTDVPFAINFTFRRGDIPAGQSVVSNHGTLKVYPKNTWPDGSLKIALLAGTADITGGVPRKITLTAGANAAGVALTTANLIAALGGVPAVIGAGAFGSASFGDAEWAAPFRTVASTSAMSSWVFRKPIGSDAHLVAFVELRLYAGGAVESLPWVENGYVNVAGPSNRSATYTFSFGGTLRFNEAVDLKHHQRTVLIGASSPQAGAELSHWLGTDPGVTVQHDGQYLMSTEVVQRYTGSPDPALPDTRPAAASFSPLQQGGYKWQANPDGGGGSDNMADTGYGRPIGQIPEWDVLYLLCDNPTAFRQVVRNAYSAGRYGIHYRDEATLRPMRFNDPAHVTRVFRPFQGLKDSGTSSTGTTTPVATGGNPPTWDTAHCPSVGYMAYLVTGWEYHLETVQFAATANHFNMTTWVRGGGNGTTTGNNPWPGYTAASGIFSSQVQLRSGSWIARTILQALTVTADAGDPLRAEFIACVEANCNYFHSIYVAQANNQFGLVFEYDYYGNVGGAVKGSPWQQDFFTAAWGLARAMDLPIGATAKTKLAEFFDWKARSVIGRLGAAADFHFINGNPYEVANAPVLAPDYWTGTGPWFASWAAMYAATQSIAQSPDYRSTTEGVLGFDFNDPTAAAQGMWGNLQPAISYAVRFGVPGALEAYNRMRAAANWSQLEAAFNVRPVWGVSPASGMFRAWRQGKPRDQWFTLPGTAITSSTTDAGPVSFRIYANFNGTVQNEMHREYYAFGDGHGGSTGNELMALNTAMASPAWSVKCQPTPAGQRISMPSEGLTQPGVQDWWGTAPNRKPNPPHTYSSGQYIIQLRRINWFTYFGPHNAAGGVDSRVLQFKVDTNSWVQPEDSDYIASGGLGRNTCKAPNGVCYGSGSGQSIYKFDPMQPFGSRFSTFVTNAALNYSGYGAYAYDTRRNRLFRINGIYSSLEFFTVTVPGAVVTNVTSLLNGDSGVLSAFYARCQQDTVGQCYEPINDRFVVPTGATGGSFFAINAATWAVTLEAPATSSGTVSQDHGGGAGIFGRIHFDAIDKCLMYFPNANANVACLPLADY